LVVLAPSDGILGGSTAGLEANTPDPRALGPADETTGTDATSRSGTVTTIDAPAAGAGSCTDETTAEDVPEAVVVAMVQLVRQSAVTAPTTVCRAPAPARQWPFEFLRIATFLHELRVCPR
jgi:hypothetical protein